MRDEFLIVGITVMLITLAIFRLNANTRGIEQELQTDIQRLRQDVWLLQDTVSDCKKSVNDCCNDLEELRDKWSIVEFEVTGYAPLDSNAVEGMCYSGDPNITASGKQVVPGVTVAAGKEIPFGTRLYIEGLGWREVQDRGGMIGSRSLDVAFKSQVEAKRFGRQSLMVVMPNGNLP